MNCLKTEQYVLVMTLMYVLIMTLMYELPQNGNVLTNHELRTHFDQTCTNRISFHQFLNMVNDIHVC